MDSLVTAISLPDAASLFATLADETRLRLLLLLRESELTVSDLVAITGQSQPRLSRHLRLLVEAGLALRHSEGSWAFFKLARQGVAAHLVAAMLARINHADSLFQADLQRLIERRALRERQAEVFFNAHAEKWHEIASLHAPDHVVASALARMIGNAALDRALDIGTGTGQMLPILAEYADHVIGLDQSPAMLALARANLDKHAQSFENNAGHALLQKIDLRQGDLFALPMPANYCDLALMHMVLHYLDEPARAILSIARCLRPQGRLIVVDFAPHQFEDLRKTHGHRRLGFAKDEVAQFMEDAGLVLTDFVELQAPRHGPKQLGVSLWCGQDPRFVSDTLPITRGLA